MRPFLTTLFVLFAVSFGTPFTASAQSCSGDNYGVAGTCQPSSGTSACPADNADTSASCPTGQVCCSSTAIQTTPTPTPTGGTDAGSVKLINPLKSGTSLEGFLKNILDFVIRIGTIVVILMIVYIGFLFVKARGEPGKITEARQALLWTVIGALVLLGAQAISLGIQATVSALGG